MDLSRGLGDVYKRQDWRSQKKLTTSLVSKRW
jgi:hypothetical protein